MNVVIGIINDFDFFVWIVSVGSKNILIFCCIGVIVLNYVIYLDFVCIDSVMVNFYIKVSVNFKVL